VGEDNGLGLDVRERTGAAVVFIRGEIDIHTCNQLEATLGRLVEEGTGPVVLDMTDVSFIDSSGLRTLITAHGALAERDRAFTLENPSPMTKRLLEVTSLQSLFGLA
jgi:anti-sigma B factor antagonist